MRRPAIHLINPMTAIGGSELRTMDLYNILKPSIDVLIWTEADPEPSLARTVPIRRIRPWRFPWKGTLVFVGFYFRVGWWVRLSLARRRIIICNLTPKVLDNFVRMRRTVSSLGSRPVELVYAGEEVARAIGEPGPVMPSPIDLMRFRPRDGAREPRAFRIGRVSRDTMIKHHQGAPELYRRLVAAGCAVRIMGGTVLRERIGNLPAGLELLPQGAEDCAAFLRDLDCFLYRTSDDWFESFGRVIFEAMACGLPVVAHRRGGYAHFLKHGEDALLFDTDEEAYQLVMQVKADAALRERLARRARGRVEEIYSRRYVDEVTRYFLGDGSGSVGNLYTPGE